MKNEVAIVTIKNENKLNSCVSPKKKTVKIWSVCVIIMIILLSFLL